MANEDILKISADMLAAAEAGDWDGVASHGADRSRLLELLPITDHAVIATLKLLLAHNEQIKVLADDARAGVGEALGQHQHRHRALNAYLGAGVG